MENEKARYQEILNEEFAMTTGLMDGHITFEEYVEPNRVGAGIEEILCNKHGEDVVEEWRLNNPDDIIVGCSAKLDNEWANESI